MSGWFWSYSRAGSWHEYGRTLFCYLNLATFLTQHFESTCWINMLSEHYVMLLFGAWKFQNFQAPNNAQLEKAFKNDGDHSCSSEGWTFQVDSTTKNFTSFPPTIGECGDIFNPPQQTMFASFVKRILLHSRNHTFCGNYVVCMYIIC